MTYVSISEARVQLSRILKDVEAGEEFVITNRGKPVAHLTNISLRSLAGTGSGKGMRQRHSPEDDDSATGQERKAGS